MTSAASAFASIAVRSGACGTKAGVISNRRAQRICVSTTDVRDDVSSAIDRTSRSGPPMKQRHRRHGTVRSDADTGHHAIARTRQVRDRGHHPQVDVARIEERRADRRRVETQRQRVADTGRARTRAAGRSDSRRRQGERTALREDLVASIPGCRRARRPRESAARSLPSASGAGPDRRIGHRRDAVDVVGAIRDRHLRQLRAVQRPVHLDCGNRRRTSAAQPPRFARRRSRSRACRPGPGAGAARTRARRRFRAWIDRRALDQIEPRVHGGPIDRRPPHVPGRHGGPRE